MSKLKVLSLFSGIGAFEKALTNLNIDFELVGFSEIDKYAIESYCAIHNVDKSRNLGDVSKVKTDSIADFDLMTYGFPCQDISIAGKQRGFTEGAETRSSLLWEAMKIAEVKKPKYMIAENVKNLIGKKFKDDFDKWLNQLDELGYNTYHSVLNAKDFGVPQNRERVFVVSIRKDVDKGNFEFPIGGDKGIRLKDILEESIEDKYYLSEEVQKRFKFNEKYHKNIIGSTAPDFRTIGQRDLVYKTDGVMGSLVATDYKQPKQIIEYNEIDVVGNLDIKGMDCIKRVYDPNGISPTLTTMEGGNRQPKVIENSNELIQIGMLDGKGFETRRRVYSSEGLSPTLHGIGSGGNTEPKIINSENELKFVGGIGEKDRVGDGKELSRNYPQGNRVYDTEGVACSQTANGGGYGSKTGLYLTEDEKVLIKNATKKGFLEAHDGDGIDLAYPDSNTRRGRVQPQRSHTLTTSDNLGVLEGYKIRKLTPLECWRLMGFTDNDFDTAKAALNSQFHKGKDRSDSQLYKQAGNSIVVNVAESLLHSLLK